MCKMPESCSCDEKSCTAPLTSVPSAACHTTCDPKDKFDVFTGESVSDKNSEELHDFIWVMQDEPHASRRKEMIKTYPELKELMGHEPLTKYIVVILMTIQLGLAYHLREDALWGGTLKFWFCAYVFGATITQALFLAIHEISHNLAFKKFDHNKLFGIFTNIPMLIPFFMYFKYYHNEHHKYQGVDGIDTDIPTEIEAKLLSNPIGKLFFLSFQTWFYALRPIFVKAPVITKWHVLNYIVQITFVGSVIYFIGWGPIIFLFASAHLAGSLHPMASHFIAEHYVFKGDEETFSYYGPLNMLAFNVGYHNEHHDFPTVPWSKLPMLYSVGKKQFYDNLPYHKSWVMVLIHFLLDRKVTLFNRVKREDKAMLKKQVDLTGNADYTGKWLDGTGWTPQSAGVKED